MKTVRMLVDERPFQKGHDAGVPDEVAAMLIKEGKAEDPRPYPPDAPAPAAPRAQPIRRILRRATGRR